jgi:hypothetical protein
MQGKAKGDRKAPEEGKAGGAWKRNRKKENDKKEVHGRDEKV